MAVKLSLFGLSLWGLLSAATVVACAATVVGFLGLLWWVFELASHFRVQYACCLGAAALVFLLGRKRWWAGVAGVFALVNVCLIAPLYSGAAAVPAEGPTVRALLANIYTGNRAHDKFLAFAGSTDPDIIVLLEVNRRWMSELSGLRGEYPHWHSSPREDNFGIALLSRIPFEEVRTSYLGGADVPSVVARLRIDGRPLTVIGTHPLPPVGRNYSRYRNEQLAELAQFVSSREGPVVVLADLNMTSWSPYFRRLLRTSGLRDSRKGFGLQATWPTSNRLLLIPLDHCLVSSGVRVHSRKVGPNIGSDHYPVVVDFSVGQAWDN